MILVHNPSRVAVFTAAQRWPSCVRTAGPSTLESFSWLTTKHFRPNCRNSWTCLIKAVVLPLYMEPIIRVNDIGHVDKISKLNSLFCWGRIGPKPLFGTTQRLSKSRPALRHPALNKPERAALFFDLWSSNLARNETSESCTEVQGLHLFCVSSTYDN